MAVTDVTDLNVQQSKTAFFVEFCPLFISRMLNNNGLKNVTYTQGLKERSRVTKFSPSPTFSPLMIIV